jgi:hypothetical protein
LTLLATRRESPRMRFVGFFLLGIFIVIAAGALVSIPDLLRGLFDLQDEDESSNVPRD